MFPKPKVKIWYLEPLRLLAEIFWWMHRKIKKEPPVSEDNAELFGKTMYVEKIIEQKKSDNRVWTVHFILASNSNATIHPCFYSNIFIRLAKIEYKKNLEYGKKIKIALTTKHNPKDIRISYINKGKYTIPLILPN